MNNVLKVVEPIVSKIRDWLDLIPFPDSLKRILLYVRAYTLWIHRFAPLIAALLISYLVVELVLWIARLPLFLLWSVFGFLSGNNITVLSLYNFLAHILGFIVALKIVYEMQPLEVR